MKNKASNRILSLGLAAVLTLGMVITGAPTVGLTAYAAMPASTEGEPWDGVDFTALIGKGLYYGTYDHAISLSDGISGIATKEGEDRPILWRVMGEENGDDYLTLMSEYVLDSSQFNPGNPGHTYDNSIIRTFLGTMASGMFSSGENPYAKNNITVKVDSMSDSNNETLYPLYGRMSDSAVYWDAEYTGDDAYKLSSQYSDNATKLKNGTSVYYWLRSPYSGYSDFACFVYTNGYVYSGYISTAFGVRPAFKLNPESVIFASKIANSADEANGETEDDGANYSSTAAISGGANYKLTIVNDGLGSLAGTPANNSNISLLTGEALWLNNLAPSKTTGDGDYTVNYKIVGNGGTRAIKGYGFTEAEAVTDLKIDTTGLAAGTYTVYTWLQKNNEINSHDGTTPKYFTLNINGSGDTYGLGLDVSGNHDFGSRDESYTSVTGKDVAITTTGNISNLQVRLSGTNAGSFTVSNASAAGFTIAPNAGLSAGNYNATVIVAGDYAEPQSFTVSFEVTADPSAPVSLTAGTLPDGIENESYSHDLSGDASGGVLPYSFELENSSLPSGLSLSTDGVISGIPDTAVDNHTFTVKVTDSTTPTAQTDTAQYSITIQPEGTPVPQPGTGHTVTVLNDGNGTAYAIPSVATAGTTIGLTATPNANYSFSRWEADSPSNLAISGNSFEMPDEAVTVKALFTRNNTTSRNRSSGSGNRSHTSDTVRMAIPSTMVVDAAMVKAAIAEMKASGANKARIRHNGEIKVPAEVWQMFGNVPVDFNTVDENGVQVRITVREPGKMTGEKLLSGYVKGSDVDSGKAFFEKWFKNKVQVIHFDQQGDFGQPLEIAAKIDLTGMDTENLVFYRYDKATNTYRRIENPDYWIDKKGYLHFTTKLAGDIVISEGLRERK